MGSCSLKTLILILSLTDQAFCSVRVTRLNRMREFERKLEHKTASINSSNHTPQRIGNVFYPIGYGADPSGINDSLSAITAALEDAVETETTLFMLPGIRDLGGVIIDFQGGSFSISGPITFPPGVGNIVLQGGSLRASQTFPGDQYLVQLEPSTNSPSHFSDEKDNNFDNMVYEDIIFRDMLFDSSMRGGGLSIVNSVRIRVLHSFFLRFTTKGIHISQGHETFISGCFLGQHPTDGKDSEESQFSGTGIDLSGNDNSVTDVVVFSAQTGIAISGGANIVTGAHCYNKATGHGGVGIYINGSASSHNRIISPYLDFNAIMLEDPDQVLISGGFFLGGGNIVVGGKAGRISGLTIVDNMFSGDGTNSNNPPCVQLTGDVWRNVDQVVVDRNVASGMKLRSTVAKMVVRGKGKRWEANFSEVLLFPNKINHAFYSLYLKGGVGGSKGFPAHAVTNVSGNVVVIESESEVDGVVSVLVDQYNTVEEETL